MFFVCAESNAHGKPQPAIRRCALKSSSSAHERKYSKNTQIICIPQCWMAAIRAFHNIYRTSMCFNRRLQRLCPAVIRLIYDTFCSVSQRQQDFRIKPLIVNIAARLTNPLCRALFGAQKIIVHMKKRAIHLFLKSRRKCCLSCSASTVNCND